MNEKLFEVGKPIPKIWLHMDFDFEDTQKYLGEVLIQDDVELTRLVEKYLKGKNVID